MSTAALTDADVPQGRSTRIRWWLLSACVSALLLPGCAALGLRHVDTVDSAVLRPVNDWSRVTTVRPGDTIVVALASGSLLRRTFAAADGAELGAVHLTGATLPRQVRRTLAGLVSNRPHDVFQAAHGQTLTEGRVRLGLDGVFLDDRRVAELSGVLDQIARSQVTEVRRVHRATRRGAVWGSLAGLGLGLGVTLSACGTNWSQETGSCTNLTPIWAFIGPVFGTLIGTAVGAASEVSTVVYRARERTAAPSASP